MEIPGKHPVNAGLVSNDRGMTVTELMVAVGVSAALLLIVMEGVFQFTKTNQAIITKTTNQTDEKSFASSFIPLIEAANIAVQYEHMPVPTVCQGGMPPTQPCVAQFNQGSGDFQQVPAGTLPAGVTSIEFFRDDAGVFNTVKAFTDLGNSAQVVSTTPLQLASNIIQQNNVFVIWPMVNPTSPPNPAGLGPSLPLMILRNTGSFYLTYVPPTIPPGAPGSGTFRASGLNNVATIQNTLLLFYNSLDPRQYFIQQANSAGGTPANLTLTTSPVGNGTFAGATSPYFPAGTIGGAAPAPWGSGTALSQPAFYPFLTSFPSIYDTGTGCPTGTGASPCPSTVATLATYFDYWANNPAGSPQLSVQQQLVALPIELSTYFVQPDPNNACCVNANALSCLGSGGPNFCTYQLMAQRYRGPGAASPPMAILDRISSKVVFARKLGTKTFNVFIYQAPGDRFAEVRDLDDLEREASARLEQRRHEHELVSVLDSFDLTSLFNRD